MNPQSQSTNIEYVKTLPKEVQNLIFNGLWEQRITEIAKKYSLTQLQTDTLIDEVLLILIGLEAPGILVDTLMQELNISRLLAEQITNDLEIRVFEYALNFIQDKQKKSVPITQPLAPPKPPALPQQTDYIKSSIPEVRPEITPAIEKGVAHTTPAIQPGSPSKQEFVQRPVSVPRFTAATQQSTPRGTSPIQLDEKGNEIKSELKNEAKNTPPQQTPVNPDAFPKPTINQPITPTLKVVSPTSISPQNIMDSKLNSVVKSVKEDDTPVKKYDVDPYREPLS
jgi:hypothetical protein